VRTQAATPPVLLLSELFPPAVGGSAVLFEGIYSRLSGADVVVMADGAAAEERRGAMRILRRRLATREWGLLARGAFAHHWGVARQLCAIASRRDTIVHCARALPEGVAAMLARWIGGPRYVCWAHGEDLVMADSSRELSALTRWVYRWSAAALANSQNTAAILRRIGVPEHKIVVVHPAVDADRFHPGVDGAAIRRRYAGDADVLLLSVGRLQRRKGHDVAIAALASLRRELPSLRYVIAGDGDERARLERLAVEHGVADIVHFAGVVADADLPAYYAASDIFLLPNRVHRGDIEGFGIVFLEAAASGRPVIGGDSGGVPEAVERDVTGLLVDGADAGQVAAAIRDLAGSAERRRMMGLAGRARAHRSFSWQRAAAAVAELQQQLAQGVR
jgi:phosphatidylinositol alpha-1,6-mannosyltransferase